MLKKRTVLITGSTRGIGKAIAMRFATEGANIILNASKTSGQSKETLHALPKKTHSKHTFIQADMSRPTQIKSLMNQIKNEYGQLDILINNAGTTQRIDHANLNDLKLEIIDKIYEVNFRGALLCIQEALPLLKIASRKSKEAHIINIASIAAITAMGSNIAYCSMKAALVNLTQSLARALSPDIRVNAVSPGLIKTDLTKEWEKYHEAQIQNTPLKKLADCEDIAETVFALATNLKYITGQNIVVDGGRTLNA